MIVVATGDFRMYHEVVTALRHRGTTFTTVEPGAALPDECTVVVTGPGDDVSVPPTVERVVAEPGAPRAAVDAAIGRLRGDDGRTIVGIDPGERPGVAVLSGETVVAAFHVPADRVGARLRAELSDAADPLVRIGDGARVMGSHIVNDLPAVPVELVDETGTTPHLGAGTRGMGDVLAAVNIARRSGERIEARDVTPTDGELTRIKERSRAASDHNRAIDDDLARRVATGDLSIREALAEHRRGPE